MLPRASGRYVLDEAVSVKAQTAHFSAGEIEYRRDGFGFNLRQLSGVLASHLANLRNLCHLDPTVRQTLNLESIPDDQVILLARRCNVVL